MANKKTSVIEINGRRYDVVTGAVLGGSSKSTFPVSDRLTATQHAKAHMPQRSQTLMRATVSKPQKAARLNLRVQTDTSLSIANPDLTVVPKLSVSQIHPGRLQRSKRVSKNKLVTRYTPAKTQKTSFEIQPLPVHRAAVVAPPPAQSVKATSHTIFERALAQANAHEQPPFNPKRHVREQRKHARHLKRIARPWYRRRSTVAAVSLSVLAVTGLVALQYRPALTLHLANARAGFTANLPGFRPAGYSYGNFSYGPGSVGIQFKSDTAERSFSLKQQLSDWNDETLLQREVMNASHYYQSLRVAGRTIYVYGQNNASWLDHGVLYNLNSNGSLSTTDILNIASSI